MVCSLNNNLMMKGKTLDNLDFPELHLFSLINVGLSKKKIKKISFFHILPYQVIFFILMK
jgi:hypothetical protein